MGWIHLNNKFIEFVTVTGADDSVSPLDLFPIAKRYPFAEFGILFSASSVGHHRFPSVDWVKELIRYKEELNVNINLSAHLCGKWVKDLCLGDTSFVADYFKHFQRIQLNFHALKHTVNDVKFTEALKSAFPGKRIIFQMDGVNSDLFLNAWKAGINVNGLFDKSGGAGILPGEWPEPDMKIITHAAKFGYAGGLSVDNLGEQLELIETASCGVPFWIDAETHLYTKCEERGSPYCGQYKFDLNKVMQFMEIGELHRKEWRLGFCTKK